MATNKGQFSDRWKPRKRHECARTWRAMIPLCVPQLENSQVGHAPRKLMHEETDLQFIVP